MPLISRSLDILMPRYLEVSRSRGLDISMSVISKPLHLDVSKPRCLEVSMPRHLDVSMSRCLDISMPRSLVFSMSRCLEASSSRSLFISMPRHLDASKSRYLEVSMPRCLDASMSRYLEASRSRRDILSFLRKKVPLLHEKQKLFQINLSVSFFFCNFAA